MKNEIRQILISISMQIQYKLHYFILILLG
jgi:hypothetical protein